MKIEKVNDRQIRCTLTKADLIARQLKISELAYGTAKAKSLFQDMMQLAFSECGFEAENIPLLIEAIPLNSECIILNITKVEDPEELDTRFSKFAPSVHDEDEDDAAEVSDSFWGGADDVLDLFKKIHEGKLRSGSDSDGIKTYDAAVSLADLSDDGNLTDEDSSDMDLTRVFSFSHISELTRLAHILKGFYDGVNSLYKDREGGRYILALSKSGHTPKEFNKICNIISEYGAPEQYSPAVEARLNEHGGLFIEGNALQSLALI